jgi:hypothetical protein
MWHTCSFNYVGSIGAADQNFVQCVAFVEFLEAKSHHFSILHLNGSG